MTGDQANKVLEKLQRLHKGLNKPQSKKQPEMDFGMFEYDTEEEDSLMASGDETSSVSFNKE